MKIVAFRHTTCDGLGSFARAFENFGADYFYIDTYREDISTFDALAPDVLVVLGGAPGVYQAEYYPFIRQEIDIIEKRFAANKPVLGVCLGAQMMAKALGEDVYVGKNGVEKGWLEIDVTDAAKGSPLEHLDGQHTKMLQWHGDTFDMPKQATHLAKSNQYANQAFSFGKSLGLQCHAEVTPCILKSWLVNAAGDVADGKLDVVDMMDKTDKHIGTLMEQSGKFIEGWLSEIKAAM